MSKTKEATQQPDTVESSQPAFVAELLKNGTAVLTAKTREELAEMVNDIPADVKYAAGAVGYNPETGAFSLRVDITNN
jgi:hypothetical protein